MYTLLLPWGSWNNLQVDVFDMEHIVRETLAQSVTYTSTYIYAPN